MEFLMEETPHVSEPILGCVAPLSGRPSIFNMSSFYCILRYIMILEPQKRVDYGKMYLFSIDTEIFLVRTG